MINKQEIYKKMFRPGGGVGAREAKKRVIKKRSPRVVGAMTLNTYRTLLAEKKITKAGDILTISKVVPANKVAGIPTETLQYISDKAGIHQPAHIRAAFNKSDLGKYALDHPDYRQRLQLFDRELEFISRRIKP